LFGLPLQAMCLIEQKINFVWVQLGFGLPKSALKLLLLCKVVLWNRSFGSANNLVTVRKTIFICQ
jgi:hypothetical protein